MKMAKKIPRNRKVKAKKTHPSKIAAGKQKPAGTPVKKQSAKPKRDEESTETEHEAEKLSRKSEEKSYVIYRGISPDQAEKNEDSKTIADSSKKAKEKKEKKFIAKKLKSGVKAKKQKVKLPTMEKPPESAEPEGHEDLTAAEHEAKKLAEKDGEGYVVYQGLSPGSAEKEKTAEEEEIPKEQQPEEEDLSPESPEEKKPEPDEEGSELGYERIIPPSEKQEQSEKPVPGLMPKKSLEQLEKEAESSISGIDKELARAREAKHYEDEPVAWSKGASYKYKDIGKGIFSRYNIFGRLLKKMRKKEEEEK